MMGTGFKSSHLMTALPTVFLPSRVHESKENYVDVEFAKTDLPKIYPVSK